MNYITPLHAVIDLCKVLVLASHMERDGWQGRPVVVVADQAITGTHRLAAAEMVGIAPHVHVIQPDPYDPDRQEEADAWHALVDAARDDDRVDAARTLLGMGLLTQEDFSLIEQELDANHRPD